MQEYKFVVPCLFGLESFIKDELLELGAKVFPENGRVIFEGTFKTAVSANIWLRCGERVLLLLDEFEAYTFDQLFEKVKVIPWEKYIPRTGAFPVKGFSLNSKLFSVRDCQAIIKKAAATRLQSAYGEQWLSESEETYQIQFSILKDKVSIMLDMSGAGLHKRGYRKDKNLAPLRETLAAAMVKTARLRDGDLVIDPMCGSGTILIEAAMINRNIAPGINRQFSAESWRFIPKELWEEERERAKEKRKDCGIEIKGFDIDPFSVELTGKNSALAGVSQNITASVCDIKDIKEEEKRATIFCNPPYGERMLEKEEARELYKIMGEKFISKGYRVYILSSDEAFEKYYGKKADKKRKLYNGMIKCDLYQYFKV